MPSIREHNLGILLEEIRAAFRKELESTGAYTKQGMMECMERACSRALVKYIQYLDLRESAG